MKEVIKKILKSSSIGRVVYPMVQACYRSWAVPRKRARLQKHGYELLGKVDEICTKNKIPYFCDWGTLLGIVRENGFIKHDDDIDITIYKIGEDPLRILEAFRKEGFSLIHVLKRGNDILEFSLRFKGLSVDFFFYEKGTGNGEGRLADIYFDTTVKYPKPSLNSVRYWTFPSDLEVVDYDFNGTHCMIPANAEEMLVKEYGPNWKTPISKWTPTDAPGWVESGDFVERLLSI